MRKFNLKILLILSLGHLVTDIYQGALPAILPFLKDNLSLSYTMTGIILMAANFTSSLIQPLFGFISDKQKKAILLPVGCLCAGIGFSLLSLPSRYIFVLMLVVISGFGIASYHPEGYKTAHFFTGEKRVTGMAIFSVGGNLGFALGPIISIYIIKYMGFPSLPFIIIPAILFTAIIIFYWRDISPAEIRADVAVKKENRSKQPKGIYISLSMVIAVVIMRSWTQMGLMTYIPFYYINHLKGDPLYAGKLVFVFLLGGVLGTLGGAPLADRWGHKLYLTAVHVPHHSGSAFNLHYGRQHAIHRPRTSWDNLYFHVHCYRSDGTAASARKPWGCIRSHGRFRHWCGWHLCHAARCRCRPLWCAFRLEIHYDSTFHRVHTQHDLKISKTARRKSNK